MQKGEHTAAEGFFKDATEVFLKNKTSFLKTNISICQQNLLGRERILAGRGL